MLYQDFDIILNGARIRITPFLPTDAEPYARLMFGEMYDRFTCLLGKPPDTGLEKVLAHESEDEAHAIRPTDNDDFIGWITLQPDEKGRPDIGIHLHPNYQNQGIGHEAIALLSNRLHEVYGLKQVFIRTTEGNLQAQRAFEKMGAILDGTKPDYRLQRIVEKLPPSERTQAHDILYYHFDLPFIRK